jgi:hypothetical protein
MRRQTVAALAASAVTIVSLLSAGPSASADLVTHCVGTGGAVTVPGDLLVPAGESCSLDGTTVTGNVRVSADADLVVTGGHFNGEVRVMANGYLDATNTDITGQVVLAPGGFGIFARDSRSGRIVVQPKGTATQEGFLFLENTNVTGALTASVGEVSVAGGEVTGNVSTNGAFYTDLNDTFVDGTLSVLNNATGSVVCGSAVQGKATFTGNLGGIQLGPNGSLDGCASGGFFGHDVAISNTTGAIRVDDNIINGQLQFTANTPIATVAPTNRIRNGITGEHQPPADLSARAAAADRTTSEARAAERRATATQSATAAGRAL